jgi:putative colanic acid biosynthesis acetyltransferase WcaF
MSEPGVELVSSQGAVDLARFKNPDFDRGASRWTELSWLYVRKFLFEHSVLPINGIRTRMLRKYGAKVGTGVVVKPRVRIHFPWNLTMGDHVWLGEDAYLLNLAPISIASNVCISQRAFLCTGSHDWSDPAFRLITKPITVEEGAWISADVFVAPGVTIGRNAVATAGSIVLSDLPANMICSGNPCVPIKQRRIRAM